MPIRFYDTSRTLYPGISVRSGDTPFETRPNDSLAGGDTANAPNLSL